MIRRASAVVAVVIVSTLSAAVGIGQTPVPDTLPPAEGRDLNLRAYTELMRRDIRSQKAALITQLMAFTEQEDTAFWPVYREYEIELSKIYDVRLKLVESYAHSYATLTDAQADDLVRKFFDVESRRLALKTKYYTALKAVLAPRVAARAVQIEHQLDLIVDLQVAAELPVIRTR